MGLFGWKGLWFAAVQGTGKGAETAQAKQAAGAEVTVYRDPRMLFYFLSHSTAQRLQHIKLVRRGPPSSWLFHAAINFFFLQEIVLAAGSGVPEATYLILSQVGGQTAPDSYNELPGAEK